ncbi:MAG: DNA polymerase I [Rectinemataceae bacterium]
MQTPLYLIDSYAFIYRAHFAFMNRPLRSPDGRNISAVFGFFKFIFQLFAEHNPGAIAAVFDPKGKTFRHELYAEYKATRQKTPEELHAAVPIVEEILKALGIPTLVAEGFEADDVIATLAARARAEGRECWVVSGDKDLLQLVGGSVRALRPGNNFAYSSYGPEEVRTEWGVEPQRILDYLTLTGDSSDNIPGVRGIGDKTAVKLLSQFATIDTIYEHLSEVEPATLRKKLEDGRGMAQLSRKLVTLVYDVPLPLSSLAELEIGGLDRKAANSLFIREGMRSLVATGQSPGGAGAAPPMEGMELFTQAHSATVTPPPPSAAASQAARGTAAPTVPPAEAAGPPPAPGAPAALLGAGSYTIVADKATLATLVDACLARGSFAFDCETDSLDEQRAQLVGFSISLDARTATYVPIRCPEGSGIPLAEALDELSRLFSNPDSLVIGQNIKYDLSVLKTAGVEMSCRLADTMIAAFLLDADAYATAGGGAGYGLEALAERRLGYRGVEFNTIVPKGSSFADVPLAVAANYAAEDADLTLRLWLLMEGELEATGLMSIFRDLEMPLIPLLARMEAAGIAIDAKALRDFGSEIELRLGRLQREIWDLAGREFNIASPKQLQEILFVERKLPTGKKTKTGFSTDTSVLEELADLDPVPAKILEHRSLAKLAGTYVEPLAELGEREGRIHTHYSQVGAATGRLSSRDPNLQNIPIREEDGRRIRAAFHAAPGMLLVSADYSQIELVVLAHLSGDPELCRAFREGIDVHRRTAALLFGASEAEVSPEQRRIAKTINFGVVYGMSAFRLSRELRISRTQAQAFIDSYFTTYAGIGDFIARTVASVEKTGYTSTILGRRRPIRAINSGNKTEKSAAERVAVNTPIQGSAADIMKLAMLAVDRSLRENLPQARILLQVHDELIVECPEADVQRCEDLVKKAMEGALTLSVPLRSTVERAGSWGAMH